MASKLLGPREVAEYLGVPLASLYQMNSRGNGPRRIRVGKHVRYRQADVEAYLDQNEVDPKPTAGVARTRPKARSGGGADAA